MNIIIRNSNEQPIYDQISSQIKNMIISGELKEGDALPSMRMLAKELRISLITTKRAYEDLEKDGFLETVPGKGCFVSEKNMEFLREEQLRQVEARLQEAVNAAIPCGLGLEELKEMLEAVWEG